MTRSERILFEQHRLSVPENLHSFFCSANLVFRLPTLQLDTLSIAITLHVSDVEPFIIGLGTLYGPSVLHMLPVSLHLTVVNVF